MNRVYLGMGVSPVVGVSLVVGASPGMDASLVAGASLVVGVSLVVGASLVVGVYVFPLDALVFCSVRLSVVVPYPHIYTMDN